MLDQLPVIPESREEGDAAKAVIVQPLGEFVLMNPDLRVRFSRVIGNVLQKEVVFGALKLLVNAYGLQASFLKFRDGRFDIPVPGATHNRARRLGRE